MVTPSFCFVTAFPVTSFFLQSLRGDGRSGHASAAQSRQSSKRLAAGGGVATSSHENRWK